MSATATSGELVSIKIPVDVQTSSLDRKTKERLNARMTVTRDNALHFAWLVLRALPRNVAEEFCYKALKEFRKR